MRRADALALAAAAGLVLNLFLALVVAPPAANFAAPLTQRVVYFHVPAALAAYAAFAVTLVGSVLYLHRRAPRWDAVAASSAEVGALLTTIALFTGVIWSRVEFFSAGTGAGFAFALLADPKFVTTAALWLVFLGYLALRRSLDAGDARARLAAVYGILGFLAVPLSYLSSRFSPHPDFLARGSGVSPGIGALLLACIGLWLLLYAALLAQRLRIEEGLAALEEAAGEEGPVVHGAEGSA